MKKSASLVSIFFQFFSSIWSAENVIKWRVLIALFMTFLMMSFNLGVPILFKNIVELLSSKSAVPSRLFLFLLGYGVSWVLSMIIGQLRTFVVMRVLEKSIRILSFKVVQHLFSLSSRFHMDKRTGTLTNQMDRAQGGLYSIFWGGILFLFPNCIEMVIVVGMISFLYGWKYSLGMIIIAFAFGVFNALAIRKSIAAQKIYNEKSEKASGVVVDSLINIESVKYFHRSAYQLNQINSHFQDREIAGLKLANTDTFLQLLQSAILGFGFVYMVMTSGLAVYNQKLDVSDLILMHGYFLQFVMPLSHFGYILYQIKKGLQDVRAAIEILDLKPEIVDDPQAKDISSGPATIIFDNVQFGYEENRPIFKNLSLKIEAGKTVALVGVTGAGKSTITRLLYRFYDVQSGAIFFNGEDIRKITQSSLHRAISIVPQDTVLFNESIFYNIALGRPQATQKEVEEVAQLAKLDKFIESLPSRYETQVGERGVKLSGGEKQRLAIARALLKQPSLFIFDEPTSSLDSITQKEVHEHIKQISRGITTILIAHRLSTVVEADEIAVIDQGKIVEKGTHEELISQNGFYAKIWMEQSLLSYQLQA